MFQLIQTACDKLCDPALKAEAERAAAQSTAPPRSGQQPAPPPHPKSGGPKRPGAPQTTSSTQHQRPEPSYRPKPASSSTNTSQDTHAKPNNASSVPPGGASTSNYPNYRAAGAPAGPYNFQAPGNNPDQDRKYAEFAKMRAEADANRRKAAQAARDAERYARMEAVRKSQETAARAKERQREEDEKYGSHQNREAANRRYREYVQEESNQYQKSSNAYERAHYEYEKDYTKKEKKEESKLPQAYQDDLEKVLRSHRNESSTKGGSSVPKTMPKSEPDSYRNYREQLRKRGGRSEKEKSEKTDAEVKSDKASKAEKSDKSEKMKYKKDGKEGSRDFESQIPIPSYTYKATNLRKTAMTADSIDLEWTMPVLPASQADVTVLSELSWRKVDLTAAHFPPWESSGKLITGCKCRKKNLVKGIQYDFRVRTAIPTSATYNTHTSSAPNMFTKSEWSDIYSVTTPAGEPTKVQQTQGVPSGSRPNKTQQEVKPKESANPTGNGTGAAKIRIHPIDRRPVDIKVEKARDPQPAVDIKTKLGGSGRMAWSADPEDYLNDFNNTAAEQEDADDDEAGSVNAEWYQLTMPSSASSTEKLHEVRIEPFPASPVIGWISTNKFVEVQAVCGDWGKVRYHKFSDQKKKAVSSNGRMGWGWSLLIDHQSNHKYLEKCDKSDVESTKMRNEDANTKQSGNRKGTTIEGGVAGFSDVEVDGEVSDDDGNDDDDDMFDELFLNHKFRETQQAHKKASSGVFARNASGGVSGDGIPVTPKRSFRDAETGDDVWFEEFDEHLNPYYVNQRTGESKWEPPEWVAEIDEASGCT